MTKAAELAKMGEVLTNSQIGGRRNIIINGAMQVAQRGTSATGVGASSGYFTLDRWYLYATSTAGRLTMAQVADVHDGFANALKLTCTTADTSIASGEEVSLMYRIEGQDLQQLKKGTSDAEKVTLSFYVKGNASATYIAELMDADNSSRHVGLAFNVTTDWTRVVLTFPADTTGTLDDDNAVSLDLTIHLHSGSNFTSGTLQTTWGSLVQANRGVGGTSFFDSTDRTFFITGVQLEVGEQATPFEHRSFGEELALCQRYFEVFAPVESQNGSIALYRQRLDTNSYNATIHYIQKRTTPAFTANYDRAHKPGVTYDSISSLAASVATGEINSAQIGCNPGSNHSNSVVIFLGKATGTGKITIDAEL